MKISKAIEINEKLQVDLTINLSDDHIRANQLGIEALKAVKDARANNYYTPIQTLPGEDAIIDNKRSLHSIKEIMESPLGREPTQ